MALLAGVSKDILLVNEGEIVSQLESIRNALNVVKSTSLGHSSSSNSSNSTEGVVRSSADNVYVNVYYAPHFYWEKCFPTLYPYGHGGPSDAYFRMESLEAYFRHVLRRGGGKQGRRFQTNASHIFVSYAYVTRNRIKNMAYGATRDETAATTTALTSQAVVSTLVDCLEHSTEDEPLDIDVLYERHKAKQNETSDDAQDNECENTTESIVMQNDEEMLCNVKKLVQRLVPFAKNAIGTPMNMNYERLNMLAMITASCIISRAQWRWFTTYAYCDKQDSRVFENVVPIESISDCWTDREEIVSNYDDKTRSRLLLEHPALVARIFHARQECLWNHVLFGDDKPVGAVKDFMRRVEVCSVYVVCMYYTCVIVMNEQCISRRMI